MVWWVAGDGLRSDGDEAPLLIQERVLYPAHRHLRAGALRGSGLYNAPLGRAGFSPHRTWHDHSPHRTWHDQVDVVSFAAKFMGLSETGGRGGVGVIRGFVNRSRR